MYNCTILLGALHTTLLRYRCRSSPANNLYDVRNAGSPRNFSTFPADEEPCILLAWAEESEEQHGQGAPTLLCRGMPVYRLGEGCPDVLGPHRVVQLQVLQYPCQPDREGRGRGQPGGTKQRQWSQCPQYPQKSTILWHSRCLNR